MSLSRGRRPIKMTRLGASFCDALAANPRACVSFHLPDFGPSGNCSGKRLLEKKLHIGFPFIFSSLLLYFFFFHLKLWTRKRVESVLPLWGETEKRLSSAPVWANLKFWRSRQRVWRSGANGIVSRAFVVHLVALVGNICADYKTHDLFVHHTRVEACAMLQQQQGTFFPRSYCRSKGFRKRKIGCVGSAKPQMMMMMMSSHWWSFSLFQQAQKQYLKCLLSVATQCAQEC